MTKTPFKQLTEASSLSCCRFMSHASHHVLKVCLSDEDLCSKQNGADKDCKGRRQSGGIFVLKPDWLTLLFTSTAICPVCPVLFFDQLCMSRILLQTPPGHLVVNYRHRESFSGWSYWEHIHVFNKCNTGLWHLHTFVISLSSSTFAIIYIIWLSSCSLSFLSALHWHVNHFLTSLVWLGFQSWTCVTVF